MCVLGTLFSINRVVLGHDSRCGCVRAMVALVDSCCRCDVRRLVAFRHGTSSVCRWFRAAACRRRSSCSCSRQVPSRSWRCARYCTSIRRVHRGCHAPKWTCSSTSKWSAGTSTDRRTSCWFPSGPSSSTSTTNRHGEAWWWWTVWNSEGSVNGNSVGTTTTTTYRVGGGDRNGASRNYRWPTNKKLIQVWKSTSK